MTMNAMRSSGTIVQIIGSLERMTQDQGLLKAITETVTMIVQAMKKGNKLLICGNGGSAADAQHVAGELVCRFYKDRMPLPALALSTDSSVLTAISNDYSYKDVFSRQVLAHGREGDILLGISTSGNSENVKCALLTAKEIGMRTVLLTGQNGNGIASSVDVAMRVPSAITPRIQEMHLIIEHLICEAVEEAICA